MNLSAYQHHFKNWIKDNYIFLAVLVLLIGGANLFLYQFYRQERFIYFWDWSAYHNHFIFTVGKLRDGIFPALGAAFYSIAFTQYSLLAPLIIAPLGLMFGTGRAVFLFSVLNVFALPAAFLLGLVFARLTGASGKKKWLAALMPMAIILLAPQFWVPLLLGFFDVAALIAIAGIWLLLSSDQTKKTAQKAIGLGILLTLLIFTRRWLAYWSFSFFPAIFLAWLYSKIKKQKPFWDIKNIFICGLASSFFLLAFGAPVAKQMLTDNYASMFQAFKAGNSTWQVILAAAYHFGWITLLFSAAGLVLALKNTKTRGVTQIIFLQSLIALLLFARVQLIDLHHYYQFIPVAVLFESLFIFYVWQAEIKIFWKIFLTSFFVSVSLLNFLQGLIPEFKFIVRPAHLMAGAQHYPLQRNDQTQIAALLSYLDKTMPQGAKLYVDASSVVLNDDVVRNSCRYFKLDYVRICDNIIPANNVDLRDGFPRQFLQTDFVLVADPPQTHLLPNDQRVVWVLQEKLLDKNSIGSAYQILPKQFTLDGGVMVKILKKTRNLTASELQNLSDIFLGFYPNRQDLFQIQPLVQTSPQSAAQPLTTLGKLKQKIKNLLGTNEIRAYFRQKLGGSDITGETAY